MWLGVVGWRMSILTVVLVLCGIGVLLWLVNVHIPMAAPFKTLVNAVVIISTVLWLLGAFGVLDAISGAKLPRVH